MSDKAAGPTRDDHANCICSTSSAAVLDFIAKSCSDYLILGASAQIT
jgi:hypothetical protein